MPEVLSELVAKISTDATELKKGLSDAEGKTEASSKKMADSLKQVGMAMVTVGAVITGAMGLAVKASMDYESAFTGVRKTVNATEAEFALLSKGIIDMSKTLPISAGDLAAIAESAGQLGIETKSILGFTEVIAGLGMATNLAGQEGATMLARFANITGMAQDSFGKLGSAIVDLGNNFATTEAEIVTMSMQLAGTGTIIGLSEQEILALSTTLSSLGVRAERGGTSFSQMMMEMNSAVSAGGDKLQIWAKVAGVSTKEFADSFKKDAMGTIVNVISGLNNLNEMGMDTAGILQSVGLGGIRVTDSLFRMANNEKLLSDALATSKDAWEKDIALKEEVEKRNKTLASQMTILKNTTTAFAVSIGDQLAPFIKSLINLIKPVIDGITSWAGEHPKLTQAITLTATGIGLLTLAFGGFLLIVPSVLSAMTSLGLSFAVLAPYAAIAAVIVGLVALGVALSTAEISTGDYTIALENAKYKLNKLEEAGKGMGDEADSLRNKIILLTEVLEDYNIVLDGSAPSEEKFQEIFKERSKLIDKVTDAQKRLTRSIKEFGDDSGWTDMAKEDLAGLYVEYDKIDSALKDYIVSMGDLTELYKIAPPDIQKFIDDVEAQRAADSVAETNAGLVEELKVKAQELTIILKDAAKERYDNEMEAIGKRRIAAEDDYNNAKAAIEKEYGTAKDVTKSKIQDAYDVRDAVLETTKQMERDAEQFYTSELKRINGIYNEKMRTAQLNVSAEQRAIQDRIDAIDDQTETEDLAATRKEEADKLANLKSVMVAAEANEKIAKDSGLNDEELIKAAQKVTDAKLAFTEYDTEIKRKELLRSRAAEKEALRDSIQDLRDGLDAEYTTIEANRKKEIDAADDARIEAATKLTEERTRADSEAETFLQSELIRIKELKDASLDGIEKTYYGEGGIFPTLEEERNVKTANHEQYLLDLAAELTKFQGDQLAKLESAKEFVDGLNGLVINDKSYTVTRYERTVESGGGGLNYSPDDNYAGGFATGGIVPGPIGAPQLATVHGGETIVPANEGIGTTVNVNFTQPVFFDREDTMNRFVDMISKGIDRKQRLKFGGAYAGG